MPHRSRCGDSCAGCERNQPARATFLRSVVAACRTRSVRSALSSSRFLLALLARIAGLSPCLAQSLAEAAEPLSETAGNLADRAS
jgi:hypothetical protein